MSSVQHAIVFLDRESVGANVRKPNFPHSYKEYQSTWTPEEIVDRLKDATIAIINKVPMRADTLKQLPKLKLIAVAATGTDVVDKAYCKANGITVVNIRNYAFNTVPEHVLALMFALRRNLLGLCRGRAQRRWSKVEPVLLLRPSDPRHRRLDHGHRRLWRASARRSASAPRRSACRCCPTTSLPQPGLVDFDTLLRESDVITLHMPLTPGTKNMIGAAELKKMKPTAILINTARGGLVDEAALAEALKNGTIAGAGFDVLTKEPPKDGNILLDLKLPNLIVTPACRLGERRRRCRSWPIS